MKLKDITDIKNGYAFRKAVSPDTQGDTLLLQAKDLVKDIPVTDTSSLTRIAFDVPTYTDYLQKDDVLINSRGMKTGAFRATTFQSDDKNIIVSSSVYILRTNNKEVNPEYLSQYLNSKDGQESLSGIITGSYIGNLPKKLLQNIEIPVPSLKKQKSIVDLQENIRLQREISDRRNTLKQQIIDETFKNITKHHV